MSKASELRPGKRIVEVRGMRIAHCGQPPFHARSASDHTDDWPLWFVAGVDGVNRMRFPDHSGAVLTDRETAEAAAEALNGEKELGGGDVA